MRPAMTRLADHAEQSIVAEEARQHVVLDLARQALFADPSALTVNSSQSSPVIIW